MIGYALPTASYLIHKGHITGTPDGLGKSLSIVFNCNPNQLQDEVQKMFNFSQSKNEKKKKNSNQPNIFCMAMVSRALWEKMGSGCHGGKIVCFECR